MKTQHGMKWTLAVIVAVSLLGAPAVGERLLASLDGFLGGQNPADDISLIVVKVL